MSTPRAISLSLGHIEGEGLLKVWDASAGAGVNCRGPLLFDPLKGLVTLAPTSLKRLSQK